jgi:hypothetical protein
MTPAHSSAPRGTCTYRSIRLGLASKPYRVKEGFWGDDLTHDYSDRSWAVDVHRFHTDSAPSECTNVMSAFQLNRVSGTTGRRSVRHMVDFQSGRQVAKTELGEFVGRRTDISPATEFGIRPTSIGRVAGRAQAPVRRLVRKSRGGMQTVKRSGTKRGAGFVGRVLYTSHDYSVARARPAQIASLRALRAEHIEYFLLHEPAGEVGPNYHDLITFLDDARDKGLIGRWGPAGPAITLGFLSIAVETIRTVLATDPTLRASFPNEVEIALIIRRKCLELRGAG